MDLLERAKILLKATKELLEKQENSCYVLNLLSQTVFYDGVDCDGSCLKDDIDYWFDELEEQVKTKSIPLDKIKQAREKIENIEPLDFLEITKKMSSNGKEMEISKKFATAILDKLIESEGVND